MQTQTYFNTFALIFNDSMMIHFTNRRAFRGRTHHFCHWLLHTQVGTLNGFKTAYFLPVVLLELTADRFPQTLAQSVLKCLFSYWVYMQICQWDHLQLAVRQPQLFVAKWCHGESERRWWLCVFTCVCRWMGGGADCVKNRCYKKEVELSPGCNSTTA